MKALSLWEPWASFMAAGLKTIETRHWATRHTGWIAIHAAKTTQALEVTDELLDEVAEILGHRPAFPSRDNMPLGMIVAVGKLIFCRQTEWLRTEDLVRIGTDGPLGDYSDGRFGWVFDPVLPCLTPIPCRGAQGLWDVPPAIEVQLRQLIADAERRSVSGAPLGRTRSPRCARSPSV